MKEVEIKKINSEINVLKEEYTKMQNDVNYLYWPKEAKLNKLKKDYLWLFGISICILITVLLAILCDILKNDFLIGIVLGLAIFLLGFTCFMEFRCIKKYKALKLEWDKALIPVIKLKERLDENMKNAMTMMIDFLIENNKLSQEEIIKVAGNSYDEIYVYYDQVINIIE